MSRPNSPSGWAREIVAQRALIMGAATAVVHVLVVLFALSPTLDTSVPAVVGGVIDFVGLWVTVLWARRGVTPAAIRLAPRSSDGQALVIRAPHQQW